MTGIRDRDHVTVPYSCLARTDARTASNPAREP